MEKYEILTTSSKATQKLANRVAGYLHPGQVIVLNGDLGAGKTTFTQGLTQALGVVERVKSPTFNILNVYESGKMPVYHFDAYRLEESGAQDNGFEDYIDQNDGVTLIEWAEYMKELLPNDVLTIDFVRTISDDERQIMIQARGTSSQNLLRNLLENAHD